MKLLVRLRRLAVVINPERRVSLRFAGRPMPSRREGKLPCQRHPNNSKEKRTRRSTLKLRSARPEAATARKVKATSEGPSSGLPIRMLPGSILDLKFITWQCPKSGLRGRFAALALTLPSSMR